MPQRTEGDPIALKGMYESGLKASYNAALGNVPILMSRGYLDNRGDIHDRQRDFVVRARLERANGRSDNTRDLDCVDRGADRRQPRHHEQRGSTR